MILKLILGGLGAWATIGIILAVFLNITLPIIALMLLILVLAVYFIVGLIFYNFR